MFRTAEAVSPAHPDKVADQISDAILIECMKRDPKARVAIECAIGHGHVSLIGEISFKGEELVFADYKRLVREVLDRCRYTEYEFELTTAISQQSNFIAAGVDTGGAGDQGIMIGYACRENEAMVPREIDYARYILRKLWDDDERIRDAKCQVTFMEGDDKQAELVVVSAERVPTEELEENVMALIDAREYVINPAGDWDGGMDADAGVTGRKIVQDAYGPRVPVGGGAFSGKDATKVDRTAAYKARQAAKTLLTENPEFNECMIEVAYAIGKAEVIGMTITLDGKDVDEKSIRDNMKAAFKPDNMIIYLKMRTDAVDYAHAAAWGHFGTNPKQPWEDIDE